MPPEKLGASPKTCPAFRAQWKEKAMSKKDEASGKSRRDFLKLAAVAAPAAVATSVAGEAAAADVADTQSEGLRKTPHTEAYLASARF